MSLETPPISDPNPNTAVPPPGPVDLARLGFWLSLVPPSVIALMVVFQPG